MSILGELQKQNGGAWVELYELDATAQGGSVLYFHAGTNGLNTSVVWQGNTYAPFPINATGFEISGQQMPRPKLAVANVSGAITALLQTSDLLGAKVIRRRTMVKYLDDVNFPIVQKPTPAVLTFTRASTATYYGSDGLLKTAANDVARIEYDPLTLAVRGLLIEEQRTNLLTESEFRNGVTDATTRGGLLTATAFSGLIGTTGLAFGYDGVTGTYAYKAGVPASTTVTFSVFVQMDDGNAPTFGNATGGSSSNTFAIVICGDVATPTQYVVTNLGGGLYRVSGSRVSGTLTGNTGVFKYSTNNNRTFKISGFQCEAGAFATSYIPTTTASVTRAADVATVSGANFSSFYNASEGSLQVRFIPLVLTNNTRIAELSGGTAARVTDIYISGVKAAFYNGTAVASVGNTFTAGTQYSVAAGYKAGDYGYASDGVLATASSATLNTATALYIGRFNDGSLSLNGYIRNVRYFPRRLTNAELQSITGSGTVDDLPAFELDASTGALSVYTLAQYNPTADANSHLADEIYYVAQKTQENHAIVEFELGSPIDLEGVTIPRRQIVANLCLWQYRGEGCGYAGGAVADEFDVPTTVLANDKCSKRLSGCGLRFGSNSELPYGGFPSAGLTKL